MKKLIFLIPFIAALSFNAIAQNSEGTEAEDITMDVLEHKRGKGHNHGIKRIVAQYMLENGDITMEELQAIKDQRKAVREELRSLREAGDEEALQARLDELRAERKVRREEFKAYIADHEDLAEAIQERREEMRERRREKKAGWRENLPDDS